MQKFTFENSTKVCFGQGCVGEELPGLLAGYGPNVLLAYGGGSIRKNGVYEEVTAILRSAGKTVTEFSGIMPNPTYAKVLEGAALVREQNIDLILAVGGGSVMDCCKAVSLAVRYGGDAWADFWACAAGGYRQLTHQEIRQILKRRNSPEPRLPSGRSAALP